MYNNENYEISLLTLLSFGYYMAAVAIAVVTAMVLSYLKVGKFYFFGKLKKEILFYVDVLNGKGKVEKKSTRKIFLS